MPENNSNPETSLPLEKESSSPSAPPPEQIQVLSETTPKKPKGETVCDECVKSNVLRVTGIRTCNWCLDPFCPHFASKADPIHFCVGCLSDLNLDVEVVRKKYEFYNEETDTVREYSRTAKRYTMSGDDWITAQRKIKDLTSAELDVFIEFHRQYLGLLLNEREMKRAEKAHTASAVKLKASDGAIGATTRVVTETKKTTTTKINKKAEQAKAMIAAMLASGMKLEDLLGK